MSETTSPTRRVAPGRRPVLLYPRAAPAASRGKLDRAIETFLASAARQLSATPSARFAKGVLAEGEACARLSESDLVDAIAATARRMRRGRSSERTLRRCFALIREVSGRRLGMRHYPSQILAARAIVDGAIAELPTGEGKTLTATLAAGAAALGGRAVHLITANDYLAARDADWMRPVYEGAGLTVGAVTQGMDAAARRAIYGCDVVYCSGKEVAFDYLRDRVAMRGRDGDLDLRVASFLGGRPHVLRGLDVAIVDEADSVMIDEARTPLILSQEPGDAAEEEAATRAAIEVARGLQEGVDFTVDRAARTLALTAEGREAVAERGDSLPARWRARPMRESLVTTALSALILHQPGAHYIVADDEVRIVDEYTGRVMPDRSWAAGLHQAVEVKEGVPVTARRETKAQITFQRFFRRYRRLAGMTGTAAEAAREFRSVYKLPVTRIAPNKPARRRWLGSRVHPDAGAKWRDVARRAADEAGRGRPVLIGVRTVAAAGAASVALRAEGVPHEVLSAEQNEDEAGKIARAGRSGAVTVATNMAGRGTDISLDDQARAAGGLHVILSERHAAARIDRQLYGRCARQGDPGSAEEILSLEDEILAQLGAGVAASLASAWTRATGRADAFDMSQARMARRHAHARRRLLEIDEKLADSLAFTGEPE